MNYFIQTYGCQYNEWEAARINFMLQKIGFIETTQKEANIIFIIACSVRQTAVDRILGKLHNLSDKTIIITGCILDQDKISFEKRNAYLWDNRDPAALIKILQNLYSSSEACGEPAESVEKPAPAAPLICHSEAALFCHSEAAADLSAVASAKEEESRSSDRTPITPPPTPDSQLPTTYTSPSSSPHTPSYQLLTTSNLQSLLALGASESTYLPIMTGCNNFCSYCAVPYTKGREVSKPFDEVISEFRAIIEKGAKEVTLLGQNVNSYKITKTDAPPVMPPAPVVIPTAVEESSSLSTPKLPTPNSQLLNVSPTPAGSGINSVEESSSLSTPQLLTTNYQLPPSSPHPRHPEPVKDPGVTRTPPVILNSFQDLPLVIPTAVEESSPSQLPTTNYQLLSSGFPLLLRTLNDLPGDFQIAFTSNHPKDMTDEVIDAIKTCDKVKKQIHLPLQAGSDKILKAMNRPYTKKQYLALVKKIKTKIPEVQLTTDVIVGFPGETEADFQETVEIFKQINFHAAYINKYSPRQGTAAYKLGDPIKWSEKQSRWNTLNDIAYWKK